MSTKAAAIWVGVSAGMMVIGAIGPWVNVFGVLSVAGTDGDGVIVLIAVLVIGAMVLLRYLRGAGIWTLVVAVLVAVAAAATSIYDMANIQNTKTVGLSAGWGLWIACIASVSAIVALVFIWRTAAPTAEGMPSEPPLSPPA